MYNNIVVKNLNQFFIWRNLIFDGKFSKPIKEKQSNSCSACGGCEQCGACGVSGYIEKDYVFCSPCSEKGCGGCQSCTSCGY